MSNYTPENYDLTFLVGKTLEQVCVGRFQTLLNFFDKGTIEVACGLEAAFGSGSVKVGDDYCVQVGVVLVDALGKAIRDVSYSDSSIRIVFDDNTFATLLLRNDGYESVNITGGPEGNLTFY